MSPPEIHSREHSARFSGFVRAQDGRLVAANGAPTIFRGVGLGNWLLPEGYMWKFPSEAQSPREIEAQIVRLAGPEYAQHFWTAFRERYITESDIAHIAHSGFDHVRLPINARVIQAPTGEPLEAGYAHVDRLVAWCERHGLHVLLDLHGAPGGQTGTNIDDSPHMRPDLFLEPQYRDLTIELWRTMATRYAGNTVVMGYDLLNEPLPNEWQHQFPNELVALYQDITVAIREVDADHLIMYEGSHWATNWDIFTDVWDENSALQFHKYWSAPDRESLAPYLDVRERLGLPIYMGEGGENTLEWLYAAFRLYEAEEIGWNLWPWKKLDTHTSPVSAVAPPGWSRLVAAMAGRAEIGASDARRILDDYLAAVELDACEQRPDVVRAVMASAPAVVPAWGFGHRGRHVSHGGAGTPSVDVAPAGFRVSDGVAISFASGRPGPDNPFTQNDGKAYSDEEMLIVRLAPGQWLEFEMEAPPPLAMLSVVDQRGAPVPASLERTDAGVRVTAPLGSGTLEFARIVRSRIFGARQNEDQ